MSSDRVPLWNIARSWLPDNITPRQKVTYAAGFLIAAQLVLRGWAVYGSWFYSDDFIFLEDALRHDLTWSFLLRPHDSHLMPIGIAISWLVAQAGTFNWGLAATITLTLQLLASLSCLLMLRTLFGWRMRILVPLAFYLFSTMSLDGVIWWSASLNTLPLHIAYFLSVAAAVTYFRRRTLQSGAATLAALCLGLLADPRGMLIPLSVGLLALSFFATGRWGRRVWSALRQWWPLWTPMAVLGVGYLAAYRHFAPSPVSPDASTDLVGTARTFFGSSFLTSIVGGPWRWDNSNPPMAAVDPPTVLHLFAAVVVILTLIVAIWRSPLLTVAAGSILVVHLVITYLGLAFGRATQIGTGAGLLMRFLADSTPVVTLALGLAIIPAAGATVARAGPSEGSPSRRRWVLAAAAVTCVILGAVFSTVQYVRGWHADYPARAFVINARDSLTRDPATVADIPVPELVQAATAYPHNLPSRLLYPLGDRIMAATSGNDLRVLDKRGFHRQAVVPVVIRAPKGPQVDCGYPITKKGTTIRLPERNNADFWWMTLSYISGGPARIEVRADGRRVAIMEVEPGVHTYFIQGEKTFDLISLRGMLEGTAGCVDVITIGDTIRPAA